MGSKSTPMILMMVTLVCALVPAAVGAMLLPPSAFAQQEETSLGEEKEDLTGSILSDVLDEAEDYEDDEDWEDDDDEDDEEEDADTEDEFNQDATDAATVHPNEENDVNENENDVSGFGHGYGYNIYNLDDANVVPQRSTAIYVEESKEESSTTSPPADAQQPLSIKFAGEPSLTLNQVIDERGLATSSAITASGTIIVSGSGGTMTLTSDTNIFSICGDDETGELSNTQNVQSTISSDPVTIKPGRQSFEITTDPITETIGDGGCEEGQTGILKFVQFIEPVLSIQTDGGNTVRHAFPSVP